MLSKQHPDGVRVQVDAPRLAARGLGRTEPVPAVFSAAELARHAGAVDLDDLLTNRDEPTRLRVDRADGDVVPAEPHQLAATESCVRGHLEEWGEAITLSVVEESTKLLSLPRVHARASGPR
ncbi:hypothetical protein [Tsukamurella tyrosinosolvens]|uniref:hypothetical protein n=1 Tax=Tsukamurella tyrosinosolvens TaxID=57704 RepID=UPI003F4A7639